MLFELPKLSYPFNALEPYIDAQTMEIHYGKHHNAYITNLNKAVEGNEMEKSSLEELLKNHTHVPAVRNNGGGHWNHSFFWKILTPAHNSGKPEGDLLNAIQSAFGSIDTFKEKFTNAALTRFGSGWAWLCVKDRKLEICSTTNQDNPLMPNTGCQGSPILGLDVWEHAYYLKYQNKRADYVNAFYNIINWKEVENKLREAK
ncbi:MAG: superoxide dismutase [Chitinophagaceae bacterium]|nr:superoxide dismutase [Chitinophagaceae bacterium]